MTTAIEQALASATRGMARYGSASGTHDFTTEQGAEDFRDALCRRYPPEGYGTMAAKPLRVMNGHYSVRWSIYSAD